MSSRTKTTYVCDMCGRESDKADFSNGSSCGSFKLNVSGDVGGRSYYGSWGGYSSSLSVDLCFECGPRVIEYVETYYKKEEQDV